MSQHRRGTGHNPRTLCLAPPFSNFNFIDEHFDGQDAIRRIFSLARSSGAEELVIEELDAVGFLLEEQEDIARICSKTKPGPIQRLTFFKQSKPIGYAILKKDTAIRPDNVQINGWHVFEAVLPKYEHEHNCVRSANDLLFKCRETEYRINGRLFCQQNQLNKACAQVALRTILSSILPAGDISYRQIQCIADSVLIDPLDSRPWEGLNPSQIRAVLEHFSVGYADYDYELESQTNPEIRGRLPYQKFIYAGVESGGGALIGFEFSRGEAGTKDPDAKHIIPVYGHTFNKDTWIPHAEDGYFHIGADLHYIPSELWTSSFLAHDDNFGPNYCIPRLYIEPNLVDYVVEIFRTGVRYSGLQAEAIGLEFLLSAQKLCDLKNPWSQRLSQSLLSQRLVLRTIALKKDEYLNHITEVVDWNGCNEDQELLNVLQQFIPEFIWIIEFSTYHLFPANERKLGEIVLDASIELDDLNPENHYCLIRAPGQYFVPITEPGTGLKHLESVISCIKTHTPIWRG